MIYYYLLLYQFLKIKGVINVILYNKVGFERRLLVGLVRGRCDRIS